EVIETIQQRENNQFEIVELNTPRQGGHSKNDRIERLEPDIRQGRFYLPCVAYHQDYGTRESSGLCYWSVWTDAMKSRAIETGSKNAGEYHVGQVIYWPMRGLTKRQQTVQANRVVTA